MRIVTIGGSPAGLYLSLLMERADAAHHVTVLERNARDDTSGWGVVFRDPTLVNLQNADAENSRADHAALHDTGQELPRGSVGRPGPCADLRDAVTLPTRSDRGRMSAMAGNVTGDAYVEDVDGCFWYQARTDDMIITGGCNMPGPEVENVLLEHASVAECADGVIVLNDGCACERCHCTGAPGIREVGNAPFRYPRIIEFADALPRTETGKLQRYRLRQESA